MMTKYALILKMLKGFLWERSLSFYLCRLVGTGVSAILLPFCSPDICLPLHLSLAYPCNANTNQHFMCLSAMKWPASGNLTSHELYRPKPYHCLIQELCAGVRLAGLLISTLLSTSHDYFPPPRVTMIARCWRVRNMYTSTQLRLRRLEAIRDNFGYGGAMGEAERGSGFVHLPWQPFQFTDPSSCGFATSTSE